MLNDIVKNLLKEVSGIAEIPANAAFNIRNNSKSEGRHSTENIDIVPKEGGSGLDIYVKPFTKNENVHIPALITQDGVSEVVYNDFHIGEGAEIEIIAGCGIHNCGCDDSVHEGIHRFFLGKNSKVVYIDKHIGEGDGSGKTEVDGSGKTEGNDSDENEGAVSGASPDAAGKAGKELLVLRMDHADVSCPAAPQR